MSDNCVGAVCVRGRELRSCEDEEELVVDVSHASSSRVYSTGLCLPGAAAAAGRHLRWCTSCAVQQWLFRRENSRTSWGQGDYGI